MIGSRTKTGNRQQRVIEVVIQQTDRQADRQTGGQIDRQIDRDTDRSRQNYPGERISNQIAVDETN